MLRVLDQSTPVGDDDARAVDAMRAGPASVRANKDLSDLLGHMHPRCIGAILVTDPEGRLLGLLHRDDTNAVLAQAYDEGGRKPS
ncbi:MAG: CBS domain-containing protein [Acidimicrobiales bacterium]